MNMFRITYRDDSPGAPTFSCVVKAHDREGAEERFLDAEDGDGWEILKIERLPNPNARMLARVYSAAILLSLLLPLAAHAEPVKAPCVVNVQTCTVVSCAFLPGIGQTKGAAIAQAHPKNESELDAVKGVGPATLEGIRPVVVYQGETTCTSKQAAQDKDKE